MFETDTDINSLAVTVKKRSHKWCFFHFQLGVRSIYFPIVKSKIKMLCSVLLCLMCSGCEEVLQSCSPCGSVGSGDVNISGDPRLDGTIEAIQSIRRWVVQANGRFDEDLEQLEAAFDVSLNRPVAAQDIGILIDAIEAQLLTNPDLEVVMATESARCWANQDLAITSELECEKRLNCNVHRQILADELVASCNGYFQGDCLVPCRGACFTPSGEDAGASCGTQCVGVCLTCEQLCPGTCLGRCMGKCTAYGADGLCAGYCDGECQGDCDWVDPFVCEGLCVGACGLEAAEDLSCVQGNECRGRCQDKSGKSIGKCRGHVRPTGFDDECVECRETAKALAWATMFCEPASVRIGIAFSQDMTVDRGIYLAKVNVLQRALTRMANDHARLALLVDGADDAGHLLPEHLAEESVPVDGDDGQEYPEFAYLDDLSQLSYLRDGEYIRGFNVVEEKKYLPLQQLKARAGMLAEEGTSGSFKVALGLLECVTPAFQDVHSMLEQLIPSKVGAGGAIEEDRACSGNDGQDGIPCLYRILDSQTALLGILSNVR